MVPSTPSLNPASAASKDFQPRQASVRPTHWKLTIGVPLLVCILAACGVAAFAAHKAISDMDNLSLRHVSHVVSPERTAPSSDTGGAEEKSRVQQFDRSQSLRRGDVVVVRRNDGANVAQVAVTANSTGLLKRGSAVEAFYVLGEDRYLVKCEAGTQVVRGQDIYATVGSAAPQQH